jgi:twinkle protein
LLIEREKITQAKAALGDQNALIMANELQLENFDEKHLKAICPYHKEKTPSFIYNPKNYTFYCFGCQTTVDIIDVYIQNGSSYLQAVQKLFQLAKMEHSFGEHNVKTRRPYKYPKEIISADKSKIYAYFKLRGISPGTLDRADVREDDKGNAIFNYYDTNDVLTMVKYRPARKIPKGETKCWCQPGADTAPLLFNMNKTNTNPPLLITEGEIDALTAIEAGYANAVSIPLGAGNYHWIETNWEYLEQFDSIIICADNDEAGTKMQKEVLYRLGSWRTKFVDVPYSITTKDGKQIHIKDLNEVLYYCGKETVAELIQNAKDSPVPTVTDLSEIEDIDLDSIDGIYTHIRDLDKELMKIFYGTLTIVSGMPGSGKTSFLYQLICQALDQDKNCWLYSKELPSRMTKNWFNYILAGMRNITEHTNKNGASFYKVTYQAKKEINECYKGRWFVYRDDQSNKTADLLQSMTDVVRKYGVKFLILDNLMTIDMDANENNELRKQTDTINRLIEFCTKFNVAVILVAHPRKLQNTNDMGLYDVSGSSNIINLAHRTISMKRATEKDMAKLGGNFNVALKVLKDRIRGRANLTIGIYYDIPSRRFFTNEEEYAHNYKWDTKEYRAKLKYPIENNAEKANEGVFGEENG